MFLLYRTYELSTDKYLQKYGKINQNQKGILATSEDLNFKITIIQIKCFFISYYSNVSCGLNKQMRQANNNLLKMK